MFDLVTPGSGVVVNTLGNTIDKDVPGARYASMGDVFAGKKIKGTGMGRGRPRKIVEPHVRRLEGDQGKSQPHVSATNHRLSMY